MQRIMARTCFIVSAAIFGVSSVIHARAYFSHAGFVLDQSDLPPFMRRELMVLWFADSSTLMILALAALAIACRPRLATGMVLALIALLPLATAILLYAILGNFYAAHALVLGTLTTLAGGILAHSFIRTSGRVASGV